MAQVALARDARVVNANPADRQSRVVVCAVEGSAVDENAVEVAAQLAVLSEARLALLAVAPVPAAGAQEWGLPAWTLEEARQALELTAKALQSRVQVDCYLEAGNPVRRRARGAKGCAAARGRYARPGFEAAGVDRGEWRLEKRAMPGRGRP